MNDKSEDRLLRLQTRSAEASAPESRVHGAGQAVLSGWRVQVLQGCGGISKYEYTDTQKMSTAAALIRAQGEQIRRMSAEEYLKDKIGSDADGQKDS